MNPIPKLAGQGGCHCGRRGLPREWVLQMYEDYKRLGSLEKVGLLHIHLDHQGKKVSKLVMSIDGANHFRAAQAKRVETIASLFRLPKPL